MEGAAAAPQVPKKRGRKPKPKEDQQQQQQSAGPKMKEGKKAHQHSVDDKYTQWKSLVPVLYDWLANHNLVWPSLSCRYFLSLSLSLSSTRVNTFLSVLD
jgi:histone-binding protein RBBP4